MAKALLLLLGALITVALGAALYFRTVSMPPEIWHVDPAEVAPPSSPNFVLLTGEAAPLVAQPPEVVIATLVEGAEAEGAQVLAGSAEAGHVTVVQRSRLMGYPDAVSIRATAGEAGTRVEVFSRSRFGYSDLGVNEARVARWFAAAGINATP